MKKESSFGILPLRFHQNEWQLLLVQLHAGHWGFPKGHADPDEKPQETAERELLEETGLTIRHFLIYPPLVENYHFTFQKVLILKTVYYFLALVEGEIQIQESEIKECRWFSLSAAHKQISFKEGKRICEEVGEIVKTLDVNGNPLLA